MGEKEAAVEEMIMLVVVEVGEMAGFEEILVTELAAAVVVVVLVVVKMTGISVVGKLRKIWALEEKLLLMHLFLCDSVC